MNIYFTIILPIIIINAIIYVIRNSKNPNKKNKILKEYKFNTKNENIDKEK